MNKVYERLSIGGSIVAASSVNMAALNSWSIIDGLPAKEALIGGSIVSAIGFIGLALEYKKLMNTHLPLDPDDPEREDLPHEAQNGKLIHFPMHITIDDSERKAA